MKAFWWFKPGAIAGMARPGFNAFRWFELPFEEAVLLGWLGQHSSGRTSLESFRHHLSTYVPQIFRFHQHDEVSGPKALEIFAQNSGLQLVVENLNQRTQILGEYAISDDHLHFTMNGQRLQHEIDFLKAQGIQRLITLTERAHQHDVLNEHFAVHHLAIQDLGAPRVEQAQELAEILQKSSAQGEKVVVHCLAGIGRTSTMLLGAHLLMGQNYDNLMQQIKRQNPAFALSETQIQFLKSLQP
jgi:protein-tyrosine phosphatase